MGWRRSRRPWIPYAPPASSSPALVSLGGSLSTAILRLGALACTATVIGAPGACLRAFVIPSWVTWKAACASSCGTLYVRR